ncbi:MAG TPA: recombinase family protein [Streptosporangiaceae bacterium]|nr:recombinase family protein [Streptosporangiaceae bacterium]
MGQPTFPGQLARASGEEAAPVPVAFIGRTSTAVVQDPVASMRRQVRKSQEKLPPGWFISVYYWDIESGGLDLDERGHGDLHEQFDVGIPRDGGIADLLTEAAGPAPSFAAVVCEDIERSGRDTYNALRLEKRLTEAGIPLFATDEAIDITGANATTVLVRRVKQGVAEWFRLQIKEKAWAGLREHSLDGWNIGSPPYGYLAEKVPHPVPAKRAEGRTKTRLILDPLRAPVVAQIFTWRAIDKLGITTIRNRLNADPEQYPPPKGDTWTDIGVYALLANPKYTGHMVWNRTTKQGRAHANPPSEWVWTAKPTHPEIVSREVWDTAQQVTANRAATADPTTPGHPLARRTYQFRSRVRCRACRRRMHGITRPNVTYYVCPHDVTNPRHQAAAPNHPKTVLAREDVLAALVSDFFRAYVFGPERDELLARQLPANDADEQACRQRQAGRLEKKLRKAEAAQDALVRELETPGPDDPASRALRERVRARFAELETERQATKTQLDELTHQTEQHDPALLAMLPVDPALFDQAGERQRQLLYQAFDIQFLYNKDMNQVTIYATLTTSTPAAIAAIINRSEPHPTSSDFPALPMRGKI